MDAPVLTTVAEKASLPPVDSTAALPQVPVVAERVKARISPLPPWMERQTTVTSPFGARTTPLATSSTESATVPTWTAGYQVPPGSRCAARMRSAWAQTTVTP